MRSHEDFNYWITGTPAGVFTDPKMNNDLRRVENLINGQTESTSYQDIWLTFKKNPLVDSGTNIVLVEFEKPILLSLINIFNYTKDPERGVK